MCIVLMMFCDYKNNIYNNMFDVEFLYCYYPKISIQLNQLFDEKKDAICCFLHQEFEYKVRDPRSGKAWSIPMSENTWYIKKIKIYQLKANNLHINK